MPDTRTIPPPGFAQDEALSAALPSRDCVFTAPGGRRVRVKVRREERGEDLVLRFTACPCDDQGCRCGDGHPEAPDWTVTLHEGVLADEPDALERTITEGVHTALHLFASHRRQRHQVLAGIPPYDPQEED